MPLRSGSSGPLRRRASALSERCFMGRQVTLSPFLKLRKQILSWFVAPSATARPEYRFGLSLELVVAAADFAQTFERDSAKFAACPSQRVGYVGDGNSVLPGELLRTKYCRQPSRSYASKSWKARSRSRSVQSSAQVFDRQRKETANVLLLEEFLERFRGGDCGSIDGAATEFLSRRRQNRAQDAWTSPPRF